MARVELIMPKLGESVMEATILSWEKGIGDKIEMDENVVTIATDKVDTEVPSPSEGTLAEILHPDGETVPIGTVIAVIETEASEESVRVTPAIAPMPATNHKVATEQQSLAQNLAAANNFSNHKRFYSPLVKSIAKKEGINLTELETVAGTGLNGRVTKKDILAYLSQRSQAPTLQKTTPTARPQFQAPPVEKTGNYEIIEMDRMRRLIADHMRMSKHVSPHVTSFVEADVTNIVLWRNRIKKQFMERYGEKITFTPIFIEALVKTIQDFPMVNVGVENTNIIRHKDINIGLAAALPMGNLIVPVIKDADQKNLVGLAKSVNDLAHRARANKLRPEEVKGGTFTLTNVGTFGNVMGTPIINQPQAAILATGVIRKKPAVLETEAGDVIAIRQMMFLSMSYDHRVVDGMLGGSVLRCMANYLENFDSKREI